MIADEIRQLQQAQPFQSFTIHTADGKALRVKRPDHLFISPGDHVVYVFEKETLRQVVAVPNITRIEHHIRKKADREVHDSLGAEVSS